MLWFFLTYMRYLGKYTLFFENYWLRCSVLSGICLINLVCLLFGGKSVALEI